MTNKIAERFLDSDTKALVEAGILTPTLAVGNSTYILEFVVMNNKEGLVKFAKEIIKAKKEAAKNCDCSQE